MNAIRKEIEIRCINIARDEIETLLKILLFFNETLLKNLLNSIRGFGKMTRWKIIDETQSFSFCELITG